MTIFKNIVQARAAKSIIDFGGVIPSSMWTSGDNRHTKKRALPNGFAYYNKREAEIHGIEHVIKFFDDHPKTRIVVSCENLRETTEIVEKFISDYAAKNPHKQK